MDSSEYTQVKASDKKNSKHAFPEMTRSKFSRRISRRCKGIECVKQIAQPPKGATFFCRETKGVPKEAAMIGNCLNAFIKAAVMAFAYHLPLRIKPDHVMLLIVSAFNIWVNEFGGHKKLAKKEMKDGKKKTIIVDMELDESWDDGIDSLCDQLEKTIKDETLREILTMSFSTTTSEMTRVKCLTIASTMNQFIDIIFRTKCGIPFVRIEGSESDWKKIRKMTNKLVSLTDGELDWWLPHINGALDNIISSYGKDTSAWKDFINYESSSGSEGCNGWIVSFFPYVKNEEDEIVVNEFLSLREEDVPGDEGYFVSYSKFLSTASYEEYPWIYINVMKRVGITSGLLDVIQWSGEDYALEPFMTFQVDEIKSQ